MARNIRQEKQIDGAGPWLLRPADEGIDPVEPGETVLFDLERMTFNGRDRYFFDWLPIDEVLVKNLDDTDPVSVVYNSRYSAYVEQNAADSFSETGVNKIAVTNEGGGDIPSENIVVQLKKNPYDADQQALEDKKRGPVASIVKNKLGL